MGFAPKTKQQSCFHSQCLLTLQLTLQQSFQKTDTNFPHWGRQRLKENKQTKTEQKEPHCNVLWCSHAEDADEQGAVAHAGQLLLTTLPVCVLIYKVASCRRGLLLLVLSEIFAQRVVVLWDIQLGIFLWFLVFSCNKLFLHLGGGGFWTVPYLWNFRKM